jgi:MoxR-like ATPase
MIGSTLATGNGAPGDDAALVASLVDQVRSVIQGDPAPLRLAVAAFLAGGHVLLEDMPGVGKTLPAKSLARSIGGSFGRIQGTPDLLPTDLTGVTIFDDDTRTWPFRAGPLFNNVVLVDALNRATPRTQSALLEAKAEHQVTVDTTTHRLPEPYLVIATQNPQGDLGKFPLVTGQRDRFAVSLSLGLPGRDAEMRLLAGVGGEPALDALGPIATLDQWMGLRAAVDAVFVHEAVATYLLDVVDAVRAHTGAEPPLSTLARRRAGSRRGRVGPPRPRCDRWQSVDRPNLCERRDRPDPRATPNRLNPVPGPIGPGARSDPPTDDRRDAWRDRTSPTPMSAAGDCACAVRRSPSLRAPHFRWPGG